MSNVDHPSHYQNVPGIECIEVVERLSFNIGNAIKYLWRAGEKGNKAEDLRKAAWYLQRETNRVWASPFDYDAVPDRYPFDSDTRSKIASYFSTQLMAALENIMLGVTKEDPVGLFESALSSVRLEIEAIEASEPTAQVAPIDGAGTILAGLRRLQEVAHGDMRANGFWDKDRNDAETMMLIVCEIAEATEALRHGNPPDDKIPAFSGLEAELADVVLRVMDYSGGRGLRVPEALLAKMGYNRTRPYRHGKRF